MNCKYMYILFLLVLSINLFASCTPETPIYFNSTNALDYVKKQVDFGPRIPGGKGSIATQYFIKHTLESSGWNIEKQNFLFDNTTMTNIIAKSSNNPPDIIIGAHYDTRARSDNESSLLLQNIPVTGANDGASGTAVLMELGNIIDKSKIDIWLVFFDMEDQGNLNGREWSVGAQYFVEELNTRPQNVIIIDMIGDTNLEIYKETNSSKGLTDSIWDEAESLGFNNIFKQDEKYSIIDDHSPFLNKGIPACLVIDIDYPYWHLTSDTVDKISETSLKIVGDVIFSWLVHTYY